MRFGMSDEREPAVVRDVEPLVRVGRPRVGLAPPPRRDGGARATRRPTARTRRRRGARRPPPSRVPRSRVSHPPRPCSPRRSARRPPPGRRRPASAASTASGRIRPWSSTGHRHGRRGAEPEKAQRAINSHMTLAADEHADRRRTAQPIALDIPAGTLEYRVPSGREAGHMGHLTTRHEGERGLPEGGRRAPSATHPPPPRRRPLPGRTRRGPHSDPKRSSASRPPAQPEATRR